MEIMQISGNRCILTFKIIGISILSGLLVIQTIQCVTKFTSSPTYISTKYVEQKFSDFPAISMCPSGSIYKSEVLASHGIPNIKAYNYKYDLTWSSNNSNTSPTELFNQITYDFSELVDKINIRYLKSDVVTQHTSDTYKAEELNHTITEQRTRLFGKCHTFHPNHQMRENGIYYLKITIDIKLYFHERNQFLALSGRMGYEMSSNERVGIQVNYAEQRMMSKNHPKNSNSISCKHINFDQCMYTTLYNLMKEQTQNENGCTVPWIHNATNICKKPENINSTFWIHWNRVTNQLSDCPIPCDSLKVNVGGKNVKKILPNQTANWLIYFPTRVMISTEEELYPSLSMLAEIGGYVGLLLGFSLWNIVVWTANVFSHFKNH